MPRSRRHSDTAQQGRGPSQVSLGAPEPSLGSDQVARRAYERFEARGGEHGRDLEDWFEAEREVRGGPADNNARHSDDTGNGRAA